MTSVGFCMYAVHVPFQSRQDVTCACCLRSTQFAILSVFARAEETALILPCMDRWLRNSRNVKNCRQSPQPLGPARTCCVWLLASS